MKRARDKSVRAMTLLIALATLFGGVTLVFACGGLAIRKVEHYECQPVHSESGESFVCGFYGRTRKSYALPGFFLYWKKVRPFGFYLKYRGEPFRYDRITVESVTLTTDDGGPLLLTDDTLPLACTLDTIQHPKVPPFSHFSHIFDTIVDIRFENVPEIHYNVELLIENRWDAQRRSYRGVLDKTSIDTIGRYH